MLPGEGVGDMCTFASMLTQHTHACCIPLICGTGLQHLDAGHFVAEGFLYPAVAVRGVLMVNSTRVMMLLVVCF